jgi:hypothetical protein
VKREDSSVLTAMEAIAAVGTSGAAAELLGTTKSDFCRRRSRLRQLGRCFQTGERVPRRRRPYKRRLTTRITRAVRQVPVEDAPRQAVLPGRIGQSAAAASDAKDSPLPQRHCEQRTDQHDHGHKDRSWWIESNAQFTVRKTMGNVDQQVGNNDGGHVLS